MNKKNIMFYGTMTVLALVFTMGPVSADMWGSSDQGNANQNNQNKKQSLIEQAKNKYNEYKNEYNKPSIGDNDPSNDSNANKNKKMQNGKCPSMNDQQNKQQQNVQSNY